MSELGKKRVWIALVLLICGCSESPGGTSNAMDAASQGADASMVDDAVLDSSMPVDATVVADAVEDFAMAADTAPPPVADSAVVADGGTMTPADMMDPPENVLFVGNSFTFWMDGLDVHLAAFHAAAGLEGDFGADAVVRGGASLEVMWERTRARQRIESGEFDVVVLQEDIPETDVETFFVYARRFVELIRATGARPVLFMAWNYDRLGWISMDEIAAAHVTIATELDVEIVPAGLAWQRAAAARPALSMYDDDAEHPSINGVYLNTCVVFSRLFGRTPVGNAYRPRQEGGINDEDALFLQTMAWETLSEN